MGVGKNLPEGPLDCPLEPVADYRREWRAYALRRGVAIFLLATWPPFCAGLFLYSRHVLHEPVLAGGIMLVWLALALIAVRWTGEFRCPRCRRRYASLGHRRGASNPTRGFFDRVCSNCKLRKFEKA